MANASGQESRNHMTENGITIKVEGMGCQKCVTAVEGAIRRLDPGATVAVDLASGAVSVVVADGETLPARAVLEAAIEDAGYDVIR
jgi:copper chaperone